MNREIASAGGAGIHILLPEDLNRKTLGLFGIVALLVAISALVTTFVARPIAPKHVHHQALSTSSAVRRWLWAFSSLPVLLMLSSPQSVESMLSRNTYLPVDPPGQVVLAYQLALAACAVLGFLIADAGVVGRSVVLLMIVVYMATALADGSRRFAMVLPLVAIGFFAARPSRSGVAYLVGSGCLAFFLLGVPLYLRSLPSHGLQNYLPALSSYAGSAAGWKSLVNTVLISFPVAAKISFAQPTIPIDVLGMQLNPVLGELIGWKEWATRLRLNAFTPYSGIGEIGNYGIGITVTISLFLGAALAYLDRRVRDWISSPFPFIALILLGLSILFSIYFLQYDLRSAWRMVVYAVSFDLLGRNTILRYGAELDGRARVDSNDS